jgi:hypothetical protein
MKHIAPLVLLALLGCSDSEQGAPEGAESNCEPLDAEMSALIELGTVLAAGRDSAGAVYVVDETGLELRAFSGSEMTLTQSVVGGTSESNEVGLQRYAVSVEVSPRSYTLIVELEGDATRMARTFDTETRSLAIANLSPSEVLEIINPEALEDAVVHSAPSEVQVEYFARLPSDELLLVTSLPDSADYYESFRLFYGEPATFSEREILSMRRGRDGGSTTLEFELDGTPVTLSFPVEFDGMQFMPGAWTFQLPDETIPLEQLSIEGDADLLESAQFECLG